MTSPAWKTPSLYLATAPLSVLLPFVAPAEARPLPTVLAVGVPLCIIALLLATIHRQFDLSATSYRVAAASFGVGTIFMVSPALYWIESVAIYHVLRVLSIIVLIVTAFALGWLATRMWRLPSRLRWVLALGVGLVALRFAWTVFQGTYDPPDSIDAMSESLVLFMIDGAIAGTTLAVGVIGEYLLRPRQVIPRG